MLLSKIRSISSINNWVTQGYEKNLLCQQTAQCHQIHCLLQSVAHVWMFCSLLNRCDIFFSFFFLRALWKSQHLLRERFPMEADLCWLTSCRLLSVSLTAPSELNLLHSETGGKEEKTFQASSHLISRKQEMKILSVSKCHPKSKISHLYAQCASPLKCLSFYWL